MISIDKTNRTFKGNFEKGLYLAKFENPNISLFKKKIFFKRYSSSGNKKIEEVIIEFINYLIFRKK